MDDIVKQAMAKWPNVPDCYGWLGLDNRGQWFMRDDRVQAMGSFQSGVPGTKGSILRHDKLIDFIQRNYEADASGCWFFQNGPQRVYIELESTPHIWRLDPDFLPSSHTGVETEVLACLLDQAGHVYLNTPLGLGLVHTLDVAWVAEAIDQGLWQIEECRTEDLEAQYGFVQSPQKKEKNCSA